MHDTTTDELLLDPLAEVPPEHRELVGRLRRWTVAAAAAVREERLALLLPGHRSRPGDARAAQEARRRSEDWAQPFPEWGLAGNAAVVVGPRALTRGVDLQGRVFLHSYDAALDPDGSVLETVLTAPVVVAHWISSQYRLSTVAPEVLGAGDKTSHNVVGDVGVLSGAHGDLRTGLPWQALFAADPRLDPGSARHEPLRLLVLVHAGADAIQQVLSRHDDLVDLARNGWLRLVSVDPSDGRMRLLTRCGRWVGWGSAGFLDPATTGEVTADDATPDPDALRDTLVQPRALSTGAVSTGAVSTRAVRTGAGTGGTGGALTTLG